jgi:hypothetical protein
MTDKEIKAKKKEYEEFISKSIWGAVNESHIKRCDERVRMSKEHQRKYHA